MATAVRSAELMPFAGWSEGERNDVSPRRVAPCSASYVTRRTSRVQQRRPSLSKHLLRRATTPLQPSRQLHHSPLSTTLFFHRYHRLQTLCSLPINSSNAWGVGAEQGTGLIAVPDESYRDLSDLTTPIAALMEYSAFCLTQPMALGAPLSLRSFSRPLSTNANDEANIR
jgi:hypothetical protein